MERTAVLSSVLGSWGAGHHTADGRVSPSKRVRKWQPKHSGTAMEPTGLPDDVPNTIIEGHRILDKDTSAVDGLLTHVTDTRERKMIKEDDDRKESKAKMTIMSTGKAAAHANNLLPHSLIEFQVRLEWGQESNDNHPEIVEPSGAFIKGQPTHDARLPPPSQEQMLTDCRQGSCQPADSFLIRSLGRSGSC